MVKSWFFHFVSQHLAYLNWQQTRLLLLLREYFKKKMDCHKYGIARGSWSFGLAYYGYIDGALSTRTGDIWILFMNLVLEPMSYR